MSIVAGTRLGPYEIVAAIGAGGMGEVYRARDPRIGREVAIKVLPAAYATSSDRLARFSQEARTTGSLNHPNVLVVFDSGTFDGSPFLVTELLEGETLRDRLTRDAVPLRKVIEWTIQIAEGAAAAHEKEVIHRDIKPENIFLTRDGRVKLLDFGLAKLLAPDESPTMQSATFHRTDAGSVLGTPDYMSPEQVRAEALDERSDIFSLGIVLAEMASGSHPFHAATHPQTMTAILQSDPRLSDTLSPGILRIIEHMLAKRPGARFQSMSDVAFALQLLSGSGTSSDMQSQAGLTALPSRLATPDFLPITFRRGRVGTARFAPDGSVVYGAAWEGGPLEVFVSSPGTPEARAIGIRDADVLAVSSSGELALSLGKKLLGGWVATGTLARVALAGGAPRRICEDVLDADWAPDGRSFAIVRHVESTFAIEFPIGKRLYASGGWISSVRFSRDGTRLGFIDHPWFGDDAGRPVVIDLEGKVVMDPVTNLYGTGGLAWSPDGDEVWISGDRTLFGRDILGFAMDGSSRVVVSAPGQLTMCDVSAGGDFVISHDNWTREVYAARHGEQAVRNLAWFNWPMVTDLSTDGSQILFEEQRAIAKPGEGTPFYLRPVDGAPAVHIGNGRARGLSPDGKWIAADTGIAGQLELIPTGVGESRLLRCESLQTLLWWFWFPDGKRLLMMGAGEDKRRSCLALPIDGGEPTAVGPGSFGWPAAISPDGERVIAPAHDDRLMIYSVSGTDATPVPGTEAGEWPMRWSADGRHVYVYPRGQTSLTIDRIDLESGERTPWQEIHPSDRAGIVDVFPVWITPDGEHYTYSYRRVLSELYLVTTKSTR